MLIQAMDGLFKRRLDNQLRKEHAKIYASSVSHVIPMRPRLDKGRVTMSVRCLQEEKEQVVALFKREIEKIAEEGFTHDELEIQRAVLRERYIQNLTMNDTWTTMLFHHLRYGIDVSELNTVAKRLSYLDDEAVNAFVKELCDPARRAVYFWEREN